MSGSVGIVVSKQCVHAPTTDYSGSHTIWVVTWLRHQDRAVGAPLQLFPVRMLLLQRCQRIEVVERRSAWDVLEVAVLQDTERHRAGTLTREETGEVVSLQACKA